MHPDTVKYNEAREPAMAMVCSTLALQIERHLPDAENKVWHAHPVWFLEGNPIVGYSQQKPGIRLMFWSGADFAEARLDVRGKKFKDASVFYKNASEIDLADLERWLGKARAIQWNYRDIVKKKGLLERLR